MDRAGNGVTGPVSDSILTIDETIPELVNEITSSNELDAKSMLRRFHNFQVNASESINASFTINEETYDGAVGVDNLDLVYPADEADDGIIEFEMTYTDLAGNTDVL